MAGLLAIAAAGSSGPIDVLTAKIGVLRLSFTAPCLSRRQGLFARPGSRSTEVFDAAHDRGRDHLGRCRFGHHRVHAGLYNLRGQGHD